MTTKIVDVSPVKTREDTNRDFSYNTKHPGVIIVFGWYEAPGEGGATTRFWIKVDEVEIEQKEIGRDRPSLRRVFEVAKGQTVRLIAQGDDYGRESHSEMWFIEGS
jgi:hypothetical protein